jgi:cytochrome bd-type quinol oxidase subunit 2
MKQRKLSVLLLTALAVFLVSALVLHFTDSATIRHHVNHWWWIYYAAWFAFLGWLLTQPTIPSDYGRRLGVFGWPLWARFACGVLTAIAVGRFVYDLVG